MCDLDLRGVTSILSELLIPVKDTLQHVNTMELMSYIKLKRNARHSAVGNQFWCEMIEMYQNDTVGSSVHCHSTAS